MTTVIRDNRSEAFRSELVGAEPFSPESTSSEPARPDSARFDSVRFDSTRPHSALESVLDSGRRDSARPERARSDSARPFDVAPPFDAAARADELDPDHHLWRNGRVWWIAFTFHTRCGRKYRVRKSLATHDVAAARVKRDELLARYAAQPSWSLSLRFERRRAS